MDEDISWWVIEFLLRHSRSDELINKILTKLPVSNNNFRLKKTLLLRSIQTEITDGSVSETVLENLRTIRYLDMKEKIAITRSMKAAHCAVAVDCTVRFLCGTVEERGKYFDALDRIWRGEIGNLVESEELGNWRDELEAAFWDADVSKKLLEKNAQNDALQMVKTYLEDAWTSMGPTFLELLSGEIGQLKKQEYDEVGSRAVVNEKGKGIQMENVQPKPKHIASLRRARVPIKIIDNEYLSSVEQRIEYDTLPTPEVNKVKEALKSSSLELQAIVTDPLPDVLLRAEAVVSYMARKNQIPVPSVEMETNVDEAVFNPSVKATVQPVQANEGYHRDESCSQQTYVAKPCLMERNSTARTYEWDDSFADSPGGPSNHLNRFHLPSPKRKGVLPLKKDYITKFVRRRKKIRWSVEEEEALRKGVEEYVILSRKTIENLDLLPLEVDIFYVTEFIPHASPVVCVSVFFGNKIGKLWGGIVISYGIIPTPLLSTN